MTADGAAERLSRIAPNSLTEHRNPARYRDTAGRKLRDSATKITSIVFCAAQRSKIPNACWGHPKPRNDRTAVIKKSAYADIKTKETSL